RVAWIGFHGPFETGGGLIEPSHAAQCLSEIDQGLGEGRLLRDGPLEEVDRSRRVAAPDRGQPQIAEHVGAVQTLRIGERFLIVALRLVEPALLLEDRSEIVAGYGRARVLRERVAPERLQISVD